MAMIWTKGGIHPNKTTVQFNLCHFCRLKEFSSICGREAIFVLSCNMRTNTINDGWVIVRVTL